MNKTLVFKVLKNGDGVVLLQLIERCVRKSDNGIIRLRRVELIKE